LTGQGRCSHLGAMRLTTKRVALALALQGTLACGARGSTPLLDASDGGGSDGGLVDGGIPDAGPGPVVGCHLTITPESVAFGAVPAGSAVTQQIVFASDGTDSCVVRDLELTPSTDAVFSLVSGKVENMTLAPGMSMSVAVEFAPQAVGCYGGFLAFPADRVGVALGGAQLIPITGEVAVTSAPSCFVFAPAGGADSCGGWGTVGMSNGQFCARAKRKVVALNECTQPVTIESATLTPASGGFSVISPGVFPEVVAAGETSVPFVLGFSGGELDTSYAYFGAVLSLQTDVRAEPFQIAFGSATTAHGSAQSDTFTGSELVGLQLPLSGTPDPRSFNVALDGVSLPASDWSYDAIANVLVLSGSLAPQSSDVLTVSYFLICN
jgi:hypothetical protein